MPALLLLISVALSMTGATAQLLGFAPWPSRGRNAEHHGNGLIAGAPNSAQVYAFPTGGFIESSPAVGADGTVYIGSQDNHLYAVDGTGTQKWKFETGDHIDSSPAVGADGTVYIGSYDNYLYAIDGTGTRNGCLFAFC
jgi:outer membrane protein assembly factor BamB